MSRIATWLLVLCVFPSLAWAGARSVTLIGISGPGGDHFADQLIDDLFEIYEIIPGSRYRETAQRLGKSGASPEEVQAVAVALRLDGIIGGTIVGSGRERRLLIAVRNGATGRVVARGQYDLGGTTLPQIRERVLRDLVRALEHTGPGTATAPEEPPPSEPPPEPGTPPNELAPEIEQNLSIQKPLRTEPVRGVFAGVGGSLLTRSLGFDVTSAPSFSGGTVGGVRADAAVFPLALSAELAQAHPVLASFGFVGSYEHIFTFSANGAGGSARGSASHWLALLVGRIPLGHQARGGTLQIESGYQELLWKSESEQDTRIPDVQYQAIDLGLGWDRPLGTRRFVAALRLAYLAVVAAGNITAEAQYGDGNGWGVETEASLTAWPLRWLWLRLDARYDALGLTFARNGTRFAHSSTDHWIGGLLEVGFAL
jgi:hypothetical protein